jgi:hypothetical protein|tara:strand:+ start:8284 stop:8910 length:627 start_codon:yes stop_codon:yes gene_type:complete
MHLYNKIIPLIFLLFSSGLFAQYKININYESGYEYESQKYLINDIKNEYSRRGIQRIIEKQDWIQDYSIIFKPMKKEIFISIKNREPLFILNQEYFYDKDLIRFKYDQSSKKLIEVNGDIQDLESIIFLMKLVQSSELINFKIDRIDYSLITGWDVITDSTLIRFGKDISKKRVKIFGDTLNYLYDNGKIPSIIDMRYKDGVALNYGK